MLSKPREKAPAGAGTPTRAEGKGLATTFPYPDHSTVTREKLLISDMLHEGAENGLTLTELVQLTGGMNGRSAAAFSGNERPGS